MAESESESESQSDVLILRHISSSLFNIPGFFVGFGGKGSSESDSIRSPTSPLDIGVFSTLRNPVSLQYTRSSSVNGHKKEWSCSKVVGLGIVNSLVDNTTGGGLDIPKQKNILFGPQVKTNTSSSLKRYHDSLDASLKSKSLPTNYIASRLSQTKCLSPHLVSSSVAFGSEIPLESEPLENAQLCFSDSTVPSSLVSLTYNHNLRSENFCPEVKTRMSSPLVIGTTSSEVKNSLDMKTTTLPIPIEPSQGFVGSLSAEEIELSEDYTCIISHGPNPKTIHIFGDCVLECHTNELNIFGKREESGVESQAANKSEGLASLPSDEVLKFCYTCKKGLETDEDIYMDRGEQAFCSFDCCPEEILEEETDKSYQNSAGSSPGSSFHEEVFLLGMPAAM